VLIPIRRAVMMMMMGLNVNEYYHHRDTSFWLFRNRAGICFTRSRVAENGRCMQDKSNCLLQNSWFIDMWSLGMRGFLVYRSSIMWPRYVVKCNWSHFLLKNFWFFSVVLRIMRNFYVYFPIWPCNCGEAVTGNCLYHVSKQRQPCMFCVVLSGTVVFKKLRYKVHSFQLALYVWV